MRGAAMSAVPDDDLGALWAAELKLDAAENGPDRSDLSWMDDNPDRPRMMRWSTLATQEPPPRFWHLPEWLGDDPTLVSGRGGAGKTHVIQAAATAIAMGCEYFAAAPDRPVNVLMWCCEDSQDELWRRQIAINRHLGVAMPDLEGRLHIEARRGLDNTLFATAFGKPCFTSLGTELAEQIGDYKATILFLDNIGQIFGGNENDRHQVTTFVNGVYGIGAGKVANFTPVFVGHTARAQGSEFAGSAAWENACRMRWYVGPTLPDQPPDDDEPPAEGVTYVAKRKSNYSSQDYAKLIYRNGVLVPESAQTPMGYSYHVEACDAAVLKAFDILRERGIQPSDSPAAQDYLPRKIIAMKLCPSLSKREIVDAMNRAISAGTLTRAVIGQYSNRSPKHGLIRP
jgi:hypothetical protein